MSWMIDSEDSPWDQCQIGIKLEAKIRYIPKVSKFYVDKADIYVNRLESANVATEDNATRAALN